MCGIAGIISLNQHLVSKERLKRMTHALAHRGPDGEDFWINNNGNVGFGHRRLAIIDLTRTGNQPMRYLERYTIIYNGEIYNYIELRNELKNKGYVFSTNSDTEVILASYDCYKNECVEKFDGMFSFSIWDEKEMELFAARDRFGEKPFFYYFDNNQFVFGSELKALWAGGIERKVNLKMLFNYLTIGYVDNPNQPEETFFENISKLPAASFLTYKPGEEDVFIEKYWDIDLNNVNHKINDTEALEQFTDLLNTSIKRRLRSDVPIGTSLSGGLDSSSVVAICSKFHTSNYSHKCFTAIFTGFDKDESSYSRQVADCFNLRQYTVSPTAEELMNDIQELINSHDEPIGSASVYIQYKVYQLAKIHNVKVLLDGQGADEVLAGYHKYYKWYWQELFRNRKLLTSGELAAAKKISIRERFGLRNVVAALFPEFASVFLERQYLLSALQQDDLTKDFIRYQSKEAYYTLPTIFSLNGVLYFNTCLHGLEELLRYADRNSMAHGKEVRLPFLYHELIEFLFSLPSHFKIRQGWTKWLLRKGMETSLPHEIVWRKDKIGFEPPQKLWMQNTIVQDAIHESKKKLVDQKILKPQTLHKKVQPQDAHAADNYDWRYLITANLI
jgi:asparagine synthase (glutamine-hydrolysing)